MKSLRPAALCLAVAVAGCTCDVGPGVDGGAFACGTDEDCSEGFFCLSARCAPRGTDAGPLDSGTPDAGFHAGLHFVSPPRTAAQGACSAELAFTLIDDAGLELTAPYDLSVDVLADAGLSFFSDPLCTAPLLPLTVRADAGFWFLGTQPGDYDVTLAGAQLESDHQLATVTPAGLQHLAFTTAATAPALAGTCVGPLRVELRDGLDAPLPSDGGIVIDLDGGMTFFTAAGCNAAAGTRALAVPAAQTGASFWAQAATGRDYTVTATAPAFLPASLPVPIRAVVRSGTCNFAAADVTRACPIVPPVLDPQRTFLVFQASSNQHDPANSTVACVLGDAGSVTCQRFLAGGLINVSWQTAELAGARVDRVEALCSPDAGDYVTVALDASVPANTLILSTSNATGGDINGNDMFTVDPVGAQLQIQWGAGCNARRQHLQLVQVPGFAVSRVGGALSGVLTTGLAGLPSPDGGTFALLEWRSVSPGGENRVCDRMVRAELTGPTAASLSRAAGNPAPQCIEYDISAWNLQRVDVGPRASVQQFTLQLDGGTLTLRQPIAPVDLTRALAFVSGQTGGGGQSVGEGFSPVDGGGFLGETTATLRFNDAGELQLTRAVGANLAVFTLYVVELVP